LLVALPPIVEQRSIAARIDDDCAPINSAISRLEREILLLREYRTRLVADVVTGKLDVRAAAARLPEGVTDDIVQDVADLSVDLDVADVQTVE
jgi:type I restriction enzyme S subunit